MITQKPPIKTVQNSPLPRKPEKEHTGSIWMHPYALYVILTFLLFFALIWLGIIAWTSGWIPNQNTD